MVFCLSLWRTGSLWWAVGFHAAWDWAQSFLYGVVWNGMDGWMEWMDGWENKGCKNGWMDGNKGCKNGWMDGNKGCKNGWMDG